MSFLPLFGLFAVVKWKDLSAEVDCESLYKIVISFEVFEDEVRKL